MGVAECWEDFTLAKAQPARYKDCDQKGRCRYCARKIEVKDETSPLIRVLGIFWLASAVAALDFDPWLLHPSTVVLPLPPRQSLKILVLITATLGALALIAPGWLQSARR